MKKLLINFIFLIAVVAVGYYFRTELEARLLPFYENAKSYIFHEVPCQEPIPYSLGTFDTEFNISKEYFIKALSDAEAIWEKPQGDYLGKELFVYAPEDESLDVLKVNLIYDYRQQATSKLASLGITVNDNRASYDMLKAKFNTIKAEYEKDLKSLNARIAAFNARQKAYGDEVNYWNKRGGAPKEEYNKLEQERLALQAESKQIQSLQKNLNAKVEEINALVVVLNRLVATLNLSVEKYNTVNVSRGESFEEGVYVQNGLEREIDIYEFSSRDKLLRVLAHEFGHALLLEHVKDPKAIMYELNQGTNATLTETDLLALKARCGI